MVKKHSLHEVGLLQTSAQVVYTQSLLPKMGARFRFLAPCCLAGSAPHKSGGRRVKSLPDDTVQSFGFVTSVTNKKLISIRCNHSHWVNLKCIHIQQRQYKPDWRCTVHTPTQNVTITPTHKQQSTKIEELKKTSIQHPTRHHHYTRNTHKAKIPHCTTMRADREHKRGWGLVARRLHTATQWTQTSHTTRHQHTRLNSHR